MKRTFILFIVALLSITTFGKTRASDLLSVTRKVNNYFMQKYADPTLPSHVNKIRPSNIWTRAVYYEGLMALYDVDKDQRYLDYTDKWGNFHRWQLRDGVKTRNADNQCCGQTYIARFIQTGDPIKLKAIKENIDTQIKDDSINFWTWIDAVQMAMPIYATLYKMTGNKDYIEQAWKMYEWTRNECGGGLFNPKDGLWWRDKDFVPPYKEKDGKNCYWSRGNGWIYAALVKTINELNPKDKYFKRFFNDYIAMSNGIANCQRKDGLWNVSLISPSTFGGKEITGSSLFLYGISYGLRKGYLKAEKYRSIADRAWEEIEKAIHHDGFLGYVEGTGKEPKDGQPVTYDNVPDFEDFGTGCFLLGATEYYKLLLK
jgi:unsaturated rhamnogalacturonyl hydrolase